jgi:hypothetical protein
VTLDREVREVVQSALGVEVVPDDVVLAVEGDEELAHLAEAAQRLDFVERCGASSDITGGVLPAAVSNVERLAYRRVRQLVEDDDPDLLYLGDGGEQR